MSFDASQKSTIWRRYNRNATTATDAFGRQMSINNFEADHIWPDSRGGATIIENGMPLSPESNAEKSDNMSGVINGKRWEVISTNTFHGKIGTLYVNGVKVSL